MNAEADKPDPGNAGEPPGADVLAGEYALGVLDAGKRRIAALRAASEPAFARLVVAWERRFAALIDEIEPVAVPAGVWFRLRAQLGWSVDVPTKPNPWNSVAFWRGATALAAAAAALALWVGREPTPAPVAPVEIAQQAAPVERPKPVTVLAHDDGTPGWLASIDARHGKLLMAPVPAPADATGRVPELWLIPAGESPRSLGLLSIDKAHSVDVPTGLRSELVTGSILAITLEPPGGAPAGVPTGPIIAKGSILAI